MDGARLYDFHDAAREAADAAPREKRPLHRSVPPSPAFPMRALGPLREAVEAVAARTQAPVALCAQSVLAGTTLAAQPHADVALPTGRPHPLSNLFLTVAASGERKTSTDNIALAETYALEAEWRAAYPNALAEYGRRRRVRRHHAERPCRPRDGSRARRRKR